VDRIPEEQDRKDGTLRPLKRYGLEERLRDQLESRPILLMSHAVVGYPSLGANRKAIDDFVHAGVELIEIQFPFTEAIADGPILLKANQTSVAQGTTVKQGFGLVTESVRKHSKAIFLIMTYYNLVFRQGTRCFAQEAARAGCSGIIVPDLPPEESAEFAAACAEEGIALIFLMAPTSSLSRLREIASYAHGMVYCVARRGVTGEQTLFTEEFESYLKHVREVTDLPIAVGFGIKTPHDVQRLVGKTQVVAVCTEAVRISVEEGSDSAAKFLAGLRQ